MGMAAGVVLEAVVVVATTSTVSSITTGLLVIRARNNWSGSGASSSGGLQDVRVLGWSSWDMNMSGWHISSPTSCYSSSMAKRLK